MSREVDLDRLADYTAGVLAEAEAAEVSRLVATDHRWRSAYAELQAADALVRADLRTLAAMAEPMPADVAGRLDAALRAGAGLRGVPQQGAARSLDATTRPRPRRDGGAMVVSLDDRRRRRRRTLLRVGAAAAAVVAVVCGVGVASRLAQFSADSSLRADAPQAGTAQSEGSADSGAPPAAAIGGPVFVTSGADYHADTLAQIARTAEALGVPAGPETDMTGGKSYAGEVPRLVRESISPPLARLTEPAALSSCLEAIRADHPGTPVLLDYARFDGTPALVVLVRQGATDTAVAVGPSCGQDGADERAAAPA